jgi:Putative DNA-binding domain
MSDTALADIQTSMLAACTRPGGTRDVRAATGAVKPSSRLCSEDRLDIYARGYMARLLEALRADFPVLSAFVGDQVFELFARAYVWACPPTSPSLFDLGAGFADHLSATRPQPLAAADSPDAVPAALARLERAQVEAGRDYGVETDHAHRSINAVMLFAPRDLRVHVPASLRLLHLDFALTDMLDAAGKGGRPSLPASAETWYAVARSGYRVRTHVVTHWQHALLEACCEGEVALRDAVAAAASSCELDASDVWAGLFTWLPFAVDTGMATVVAPG